MPVLVRPIMSHPTPLALDFLAGAASSPSPILGSAEAVDAVCVGVGVFYSYR